VVDELAQFEVKCDKDAEDEPPVDDIRHAPWEIARAELMAQLDGTWISSVPATLN
jgi:hypothetical protein